MSIALMTMAWKMNMQAGRKMVLLAMCDSASDEGKCWPSIEALMTKCSMGERTVQSHITEMEKSGIVKRDMRAGRSTVYTIDLDKLRTPAESAPPQESHLPPQDSTNTPADSAPTPAELAPRTIKETKAEPKKKRKVARGSRLPADWALLGRHAKAAAEVEPGWTPDEIRLIGDKFRDHWISVPGQKGIKLNWDATWRNWCRNEKSFGSAKSGARGSHWSTDEMAISKGKELGIEPLPGDSMYTFKRRIDAILEKGAGTAPPAAPRITTPPELPQARADVSPENRAAALNAARALKPKDPT